MHLSVRHVSSVRELTSEDVALIMETAISMKAVSKREIKKVPTLRGKTVINCFFENSTRTRMSFEVAAKRLSADTYNFTASASSISKGETIIDTVKNLNAFQPDIIVVRHTVSGTPLQIAEAIDHVSVINAGDGINEHPTQALLDLYTMIEKRGSVKALKVAIVGDIYHSRVARSNMWLLRKMGAEVTVVAPSTLLPDDISVFDVNVTHSIEEVMPWADVIMMLRIQTERLDDALFPNAREYAKYFGLNRRLMTLAKKEILIMHPGPVNRGVEIEPELADGLQSVILDQVENGVAVRMALLYLLGGGHHESP